VPVLDKLFSSGSEPSKVYRIVVPLSGEVMVRLNPVVLNLEAHED